MIRTFIISVNENRFPRFEKRGGQVILLHISRQAKNSFSNSIKKGALTKSFHTLHPSKNYSHSRQKIVSLIIIILCLNCKNSKIRHGTIDKSKTCYRCVLLLSSPFRCNPPFANILKNKKRKRSYIQIEVFNIVIRIL